MKVEEKELLKPVEEWSKIIIIRTPQFMGSQERFDWTEQSGTIDYDTLIFKPDFKYHKGRVGPHGVRFNSVFQFLCYAIL